jgi:hypothetical protein
MTAPKNQPEVKTEGENVTYTVDGNTLTITIDLAHRNDVGKEKTLRVASTMGNKELAPGVVVGINAYAYRNPR